MKKNAYNLARLPFNGVVEKWCDFIANYARNTLNNNGFNITYDIGSVGKRGIVIFYDNGKQIGGFESIDIDKGFLLVSMGGKKQKISLSETPMKIAEVIVKMVSSSGKSANNIIAHTNREAFNKENPIELLSQLLKVLRRDGLQDSVDLLKRHKLLKVITEEYLEVKRRVASGKPAFPQMRKGDRIPAKAIIMGENGGDRTQSMFFQEVADGYAFLALRTERWEDSRRDTYDMYLIDSDKRKVVEFLGTHPSWRGFQSWLDSRISKGKFDHLGGMKSASFRVAEQYLKSL